MDTRYTARILSQVTLLGLFAAAAANADATPGIWQKHQYSFFSMSITSTYSCDGLADKLKVLLLAAGARADAKASGICSGDFGRPDKLAQAELTFYTLAPDTDGNAGAAKAADGKAGEHQQADGQWRPVTLAVRSPRELGLGDCELVDQFRAQVLPMFATRDVNNQTTCVPHQESGSNISVKFESFTAIPTQPPARAAN
jgi:hypothetical protein